MKKRLTTKKATTLLVFIFVLLISFRASSQAPYIGQNAQEVKRQIEYEVQSYYNAQGYHQVRMDHRTDYKNGQISDVIICKENVPMVDLMKAGDFCTHYVMNNGQLSFILTQYSNISIEELEKVMSSNSLRIGNYFFSDDNETYNKVYLSQTGLATKEYRSVRFTPLPLNVKNQLIKLREQKEHTIKNQPFDFTNAIDYNGFSQQKNKVFYTYLDGMTYRRKINKDYVNQSTPYLKAIIGYYSSISYSDDLPKILNLGEVCSDRLIRYICKYFNNSAQILKDLSQCSARVAGDEYSLNRLEITEVDSIITVSYAMTYYKDNKSQDDVIDIDQFKLNNDNTLSILKLSSKESLQQKSESINDKIYDVKEADPNAYETFKADLKNAFLRVLKVGSYSRPSFDELLNRMNRQNFTPSWSVSNNYNINWTIKDNSREGQLVGNTWVAGSKSEKLIKNDNLNKGDDPDYELLNSCRIYIPSIRIDGVEAKQRSININNVEVEFERGISFAKIKNDNIDFVKFKPSSNAEARIRAKLVGIQKGTYLIKYEFGNVMGDNYENITFEKVKSNSSWMTTAGAIGLGLLKL